VLLLDKTGTITLGNRMATAFLPAPNITPERLADAAQLASLADETPEGRSIVVLAKEKFNLRGREVAEPHATFVRFTAQTRMSGVDFPARNGQPARSIRKGAADSIRVYVDKLGGELFRRPSSRALTKFHARAARRSLSPKDAMCSASFISRTW